MNMNEVAARVVRTWGIEICEQISLVHERRTEIISRDGVTLETRGTIINRHGWSVEAYQAKFQPIDSGFFERNKRKIIKALERQEKLENV